VLVHLADEGDGFLTRSEPLLLPGIACYRCTARALPKGKTSRVANPGHTGDRDVPSVKAVPLHALPVDADKWPNIFGFDPRSEGEKAWKWMLSVMHDELTKVQVSAWWSSSCKVRQEHAPATLSARFWVWMDTALDPAEAGALLEAFDRAAKAYFRKLYDDASNSATYLNPALVFKSEDALVDPRVALVSQRIYVASPRFVGGAVDPLPGGLRCQLLPGKPELDVAAVLASLPPPATDTRKPRVQKTDAEPAMNRLPKARSLEWSAPGQVVPLAAAGREISAMRSACKAAVSGTAKGYREECDLLFQTRVALEQVELAALRGGLTEGNRNNSCLMIASAVVAAMPLTATVADCQFHVRALLLRVVGADWIATEWEGKGDSAILQNFLAAQRGETGLNGWDPRYTYFNSALLAYWQPTMHEVRTLGLMSLLSEAQRSQMRRDAIKAAKALTETPKQVKARQQAIEAHRLLATGLTRRGVARVMGFKSPTTVNRWLNAPVPTAPAAAVMALAA
jgi:hypothetical protein